MSSSKKSWFGGIAAAAALVLAGPAPAAITWSQTYAPTNGYVTLKSGWDFSYSHDLSKGNSPPAIESSGGMYRNSGSFAAFDAATDFFISASLTLYFADDGDNDSNYPEYVKFKIEDNSADDWSDWSSWLEIDGAMCTTGTRTIFTDYCRTDKYDDRGPYSVNLASIFDDNLLKVKLDSKDYSYKDFWFKGSVLEIVGDTRAREVPEPATLGLLGLGLIGLGTLRRRKTAA